MRVLVVDDDPDVRQLLEEMLRLRDCDVATAASVREARELLAARLPDLVITDLCMPGEDGLALLAHCREHYPGVPVAIVTAWGDADSYRAAREQGAIDWIEKPIEPDVLDRVLMQAHALHLPSGRARLDALHAVVRSQTAQLATAVAAFAALRA